jgi:hypothetical protein
MLRGEFRFENGLIVPNNITIAGAELILGAAFRADTPVFWIGLCNAVFESNLTIQDVDEPTLAVNGYARLAVARSVAGWPGGGVVNGESFVESLPLVWTPTGAAFDKPVTRMFICNTESDQVGDVFCLSGALPDELTLDPTTLLTDRTFKYRVYLR